LDYHSYFRLQENQPIFYTCSISPTLLASSSMAFLLGPFVLYGLFPLVSLCSGAKSQPPKSPRQRGHNEYIIQIFHNTAPFIWCSYSLCRKSLDFDRQRFLLNSGDIQDSRVSSGSIASHGSGYQLNIPAHPE
jgi:hypothetical protein